MPVLPQPDPVQAAVESGGCCQPSGSAGGPGTRQPEGCPSSHGLAKWAGPASRGPRAIRTRPGVMARIRSVDLNVLRANSVHNISLALYANAVSFDQLLALGTA